MQLVFTVLKYTLLAFVLLLAITIAGLLAWRAMLQSSAAEALAIDPATGIEESGFVDIGGIEQWLQIRGTDRENPVLLLLNGGPGASWLRATQVLQPWEDEFVMVQWDQRGAGRSYGRSGDAVAATMNIETMIRDGIEVAEHLTRRLGRDKIILVGHGWGSLLAVHMAQQRPELFHAVVGAAQMGDMKQDMRELYLELNEEALSSGNVEAQRQLLRLMEPPYATYQEYLQLFQLRTQLFPERSPEVAPLPYAGLAAPDYSLKDIYHLLRGMQLSPGILFPAIVNHDLRSAGSEFSMPFFVFHGTEDRQMPIESARDYFEEVSATYKYFLELPGQGHFAFLEDGFLEELVFRVKPYAYD